MKYIIGNWKMNMTPDMALKYLNRYSELVADVDLNEKTLMLCVPYIDMFYTLNFAQGTNVIIGGQNAFYEESGAYTGEVSAKMLSSLGIKYCIVGHSERRKLFFETSEVVSKKVKALCDNGITPILCVGEDYDTFKNGNTKEFIKQELEESLEGVSENDLPNLIVAYEPIWAIGTGNTCDTDTASEICGYIYDILCSKYNNIDIYVLYGGSVNEDNAKEIIYAPNISGVLVGSASLDPKGFANISKL